MRFRPWGSDVDLEALRKRRGDLQTDLSRLEASYDRENKEDERIRLEKVIKERRSSLQALEAELRPADQLQRAADLESNQAWQAAIRVLEQLAAEHPEIPDLSIEIARLQERAALGDRLKSSLAGLTRRRREIPEVWRDVGVVLRRMRDTGVEEEELLVLVEEFLDGGSQAEEFVRDWKLLHASADEIARPNFSLLGQRLFRGEMALFLGSEVARAFDNSRPGIEELAAVAARNADCDQLAYSLATVGELYDLTDYGRTSLLRTLRDLMGPDSAEDPSTLPLYELLAEIPRPLVVVSASWDERLEETWIAAGRKFAVVTPQVVDARPGEELALTLYDSSRTDREGTRIATDALSGHRLVEKGYSLVFKTRGAITRAEEAVVVSERDHFALARHQNRLIPSYVVTQLSKRGLLILGFAARAWEDRLLLDALLEKRRSSEQPYVARVEGDRLETAFWQLKARRYNVQLPDLVRELSRHRTEGEAR